jgi:hypothetical protein
MRSCLILIFLFLSYPAKAKEEKVIDFKNIRDVLKNDGLMKIEEEKKEEKQIEKKAEIDQTKKYYQFPTEDDFWTFFSEYWLVKNAPILKWDFRKPDYAVIKTFTILLESLGMYEKKVKILYINTPTITHYGLPTNPNEFIFLISLPFIRTMDLSKLEISILLLEDLFRVEEKLFLENIDTKKVSSLFGTNFQGKKLDKAVFDKLLENYDLQLYDKGFTFKQQFSITKKMDAILKSDQKLWNTYYKLLKKMDELTKNNIMYQNHAKMYPSPELQLNWLSPPKKSPY